MTRFLKWTTISLASAAAAVLAYRWMSMIRDRLEQGLARVERIAEEAKGATAHTHDALAETAEAVRDVRQTIS